MRIGGINAKDNKRVVIALTAIFGIGKSSSQQICEACGISQDRRAGSLSDLEVSKLKTEVSKRLTEGDLRRFILSNIRRLTNMNCYRGTRHKRNLPTRGQRTRTNSRTRRRLYPSVRPKTPSEKR